MSRVQLRSTLLMALAFPSLIGMSRAEVARPCGPRRLLTQLVSMLRRLLDLLDRDGLVALQDIRELRGKPSNDDRRTGLSRSYRGNLEAFLGDLRKDDLLAILARDFVVRGRRYSTGGLGGFSRDDLQKMAFRLFVRGDVPLEFVELEDNAFVITDVDDESEDDDPNSTLGDEDGEGVEGVEAGSAEADVGPTLAGAEWGRARKIPVLLRALGMEVPERLLTARFRGLLQRLAALGIEAQLQDGTPLTTSDESPGIYEKLRLRKRQNLPAVEPDAGSEPRHKVESFAVELSCWPGAVAGTRARVECAIEDGPSGLRIDSSVHGLSAVCRETHELVLGFLSVDERARLNSATVTLRLQNFPPVVDEVRASLAVALALVAVAQRRRPMPGLVVLGELSPDGEVVSLPDVAVMQALSPEDRALVLPASSLDGTDFSGLPGEVDLLPVTRLGDAVQLALRSPPAA